MRICLLRAAYASAEAGTGAVRDFAAALARLGHCVAVVACGDTRRVWRDGAVQVFELAVPSLNHYSPQNPELNRLLTISQALYECLAQLSTEQPFDIVDLPLHNALSFVTLYRHAGPAVLRLDAQAATYTIVAALERASLGRAAAWLAPAGAQLRAARGACPAFAGPQYVVPAGVAAAADTVRCYQQAIEQSSVATPAPIYQLMEALDVGDGVSQIVRDQAMLLADAGHPRVVLGSARDQHTAAEVGDLHLALRDPASHVIVHYSGYNRSLWLLPTLRGRKALHYHNITPPEYFAASSAMYWAARAGYEQLRRVAAQFDVLVGDSRYNLAEVAGMVPAPRPALVLYPLVDAGALRAQPHDQTLAARLRLSSSANLLFVGRVARNKRQERLMRLFDYYWREINRDARLWLVGNDQVDTAYRAELEALRAGLASGARITFTGKITDTQLMAYYRAADAFVCASEHEGFCIPIAQAMALELPVLAYAAAAVPETMGGAGLLVQDWDVPVAAARLAGTLADHSLRAALLEQQAANVARFAAGPTRARFAALVRYLGSGAAEPGVFETLPAFGPL